MATNDKGRTAGDDATQIQTDHGNDSTATVQTLSTSPRVSKYRAKLNRRAMADAAERPLAIALLTALQSKGAA